MLRFDFQCRSRRGDSPCPSQCENLIAADVSRNLAVPGVQISQLMASLKCREGSADRVASARRCCQFLPVLLRSFHAALRRDV